MEIKVIENTVYGLFLSFLILEDKKNITYIFPSDFNKIILDKMYKKKKKIILSSLGTFKSGIFKHYLNLVKYKLKKPDKNIKVYGNDHTYISIPYWKNEFYLIEDGTLNYTFFYKRKKSIKEKIKRIIKLLPSDKKCYGLRENIKKIYLTGVGPIPKEIYHKVEIIDLKELWNKKNLEEQNEILDIFSFDLNIKEKIKGRNIILFTQPLSEDSVITEEEKLKIYLEIIKKYPKERLVIKTHPREKTDYKNIFQECLVLDNPFPFEILKLLDVEFNKAVTLFSTAALGLGKEVEIDFYGTEVHMKILERFGSCDNIMKRNCFLKEER
ncbi:glycosyltransferase family 52 [Cetobacterium somerae]|uniref:glycosyltransferase family 52 n=1 Tax=Cetobacterium somerae TaxID=188913 RepID=UPI00248DD1EF|nr:glycosyltransferase family 52 [Cetobacterium somerae]